MKGGTELTIVGKDLGKTFNDIVSNVDVIGIQCNPQRDKYIPSRQIVCVTGEFHASQKDRGQVSVTVNGLYVARSRQQFTYVVSMPDQFIDKQYSMLYCYKNYV